MYICLVQYYSTVCTVKYHCKPEKIRDVIRQERLDCSIVSNFLYIFIHQGCNHTKSNVYNSEANAYDSEAVGDN